MRNREEIERSAIEKLVPFEKFVLEVFLDIRDIFQQHPLPPPYVCTGTGTLPTDSSLSTLDQEGLCGICFQKVALLLRPTGAVCVTHPYKPRKTG